MQRRQIKALRLTCAVAAAVFLFFLIDLTPHRVHHMFDEHAENTCVAFTMSKGCALSAPSAPYVAAFTLTLQPVSPSNPVTQSTAGSVEPSST